MMPLTTDIRDHLEAYTDVHGIPGTARELGMSRLHLWRIVNGKRSPGAAYLDAIGELLGLEVRKKRMQAKRSLRTTELPPGWGTDTCPCLYCNMGDLATGIFNDDGKLIGCPKWHAQACR